jgi:hypothetical protein
MVRTMPVVVVEEERETVGALSRGRVSVSISPFAQGGLDEALGFAVGFGGVEASEAMLEAEARDFGAESGGAVSGAVVGVKTLDANPEVGKEGKSEVEEGNDAASGLVRKDGGEGETRVVVDGDVQILPTGPAGVVELAVAGDAMAWADNAGELLNIEVEEVTRSVTLVTHGGRRRFESGETMETMAAKNAADGGFRELGKAGDLKARQLVAAEREHASHAERMGGGRRRRRFGRAISQSGQAFGLEASEPLVDGAFGESKSRGDLGDGLVKLKNPMDHLGSTQRGKPGLTMHVHAAVLGRWLV